MMKNCNRRFLNQTAYNQFKYLVVLAFSHKEQFSVSEVVGVVGPLFGHFRENNNTVRQSMNRNMQEMVKDGTVVRVETGVYQWVTND